MKQLWGPRGLGFCRGTGFCTTPILGKKKNQLTKFRSEALPISVPLVNVNFVVVSKILSRYQDMIFFFFFYSLKWLHLHMYPLKCMLLNERFHRQHITPNQHASASHAHLALQKVKRLCQQFMNTCQAGPDTHQPVVELAHTAAVRSTQRMPKYIHLSCDYHNVNVFSKDERAC